MRTLRSGFGRYAAIVGIMALSAGMLAACGGGSSNNSSSGKSNGPISLTEEDYYTTNPGNQGVQKVLNAYMKLHPNVHIKRTALTSNANYVPKLLEQASSGNLPDLLMLDNPYVPQFAQTGTLEPLNSLGTVPKGGFISTVYKAGLYKGKMYAMPLYTNTIALFYNKPMLAAAHVTPPTTWAQLLVDAKKLTTKQHFGLTFQGEIPADGITWDYEPFLWSNGGSLEHLTAKPAVQALTLLHDLVKEGAVSPEVINWTQQNEEEQFAAGQAAMMINGPWNFPTLEQVKNLSYGVVELPLRTPSEKEVVPLGGEFWTIPKTTPAKEKAAFKVLQYMFKSDASLSVAMGDIPSRLDSLSAGLHQENPLTQPFLKEIESGGRTRTKEVGTAYNTIANDIDPLLDDAIVGHMSVKAALAQSAKDVSQALANSKG